MTLPVVEFLTQRMQEYDPEYELRPGTAFTDLFILPVSYMTQPIVDQLSEFEIGQSISRILALDDPNAYSKEKVDALVGNLYVTRVPGNISQGIARLVYQEPLLLNYVAGSLSFRNIHNKEYTNVTSILVTAQEMAQNIQEEFYYIDVVIQSDEEGAQHNAAPYEIVFVNDPLVIQVYNENNIIGGVDEEDNVTLLNRTKASIGARDMNTTRGLLAFLYEHFPQKLTAVQGIGFLDPEMMRDIYYNFHIGGQIDAWVKNPAIQTGSMDITALNYDFSRILQTTTALQMVNTEWLPLGGGSLDETEHAIVATTANVADGPASFISYIDLTLGIDLLVARFISLETDTLPLRDVNLAGANPEKTVAIEIVNALNISAGITIASLKTNPVIISTRSSGYTTGTSTDILLDPLQGVFYNTAVGDSVAIFGGSSAGTYYVTAVLSDNELQLDRAIPDFLTNSNYSITRVGTYVKITTTTASLRAFLLLDNPVLGDSALNLVFGLPGTTTFNGLGPMEYVRDVHYEVDVAAGAVRRIIAVPPVIPLTTTGKIVPGIHFEDIGSNAFVAASVGDILTIFVAPNNGLSSTDGIDFRILEKVTDNKLRVDTFFEGTDNNVTYQVTSTGIKNGALVLFSFGYNPLSIDVGNLVSLDENDRVLGIRPGRESATISDMAYLWTESIEVIDPATGDPTGVVLDPIGGYGQGGYGQGPYGIGSRADYRLYTEHPELRFSALENSMLLIGNVYLGESLRVKYKYAPDLVEMYFFAVDDANRVLDAMVLPRHFIPALVDMTVEFKVPAGTLLEFTDDEIMNTLIKFIDTREGKHPIDSSDVIDVILSMIDPSRTANVQVVTPFMMTAHIHNTDGSLAIASSSDSLAVPSEKIPKYTPHPLSPRTAHWISRDVVVKRV